MNRVDEVRKEQGISREEKLAIRLGEPKSYLSGRTNYLSKGEREYRKEIKEAAQKEFGNFKTNCSYGDYDDSASPRVSAMAQLCTAANLIRDAESIEELSDKVGELNDTIYSYSKEKFLRKM